MKKINFETLKEKVFEHTLDNGLKIYFVNTKNKVRHFVSITSKYGSINTSYEVNKNGNIESYNTVDGVAHFLEHKLFASEDNEDVFTKFSKYGSSCNAYTSYDRTSYNYFGTKDIKETLKLLLDFVYSPYFTDENIKKECGIIEQEIGMSQDDIEVDLYFKLLQNMLHKSKEKNIGLGSVFDINSITKELLYDLYNTFYHPKNMFLIIASNENEEELLSYIEDIMKDKTFNEFIEPKFIYPNEEDTVVKEYAEYNLNLPTPKISYGIKIPNNIFDIQDKYILVNYSNLLLECLFSDTSDFFHKLKDNNIIQGKLNYYSAETQSHNIFVVETNTEKINEFTKEVDNYLLNISITKEEFDRKLKVKIANYINIFENAFTIEEYLNNNLIIYNKIINNPIEILKSLNYDDFIKFLNKISFENKTVLVAK